LELEAEISGDDGVEDVLEEEDEEEEEEEDGGDAEDSEIESFIERGEGGGLQDVADGDRIEFGSAKKQKKERARAESRTLPLA
jgi:hypothetical protein